MPTTTTRIPPLTRREAHAIVQALRALEAVRLRAEISASAELRPMALHARGRVSARAQTASEALTQVLITLYAYADSARAQRELDAMRWYR